MEKVQVLLIGGPCDGMRMTVIPGQPSLQAVPMEKLPPPMVDYNRDAVSQTRQVYTYYRATLRAKNGVDHDVYVYGEIDVVVALIKGYQDHVGVDHE
jgi:hypothetical protein